MQLTGYKTYQNGKIILPKTPVNGTLDYSEWGHTSNKSGNETSYTVSIKMDDYITIDGKSVNRIFLTHMSGIRYR